MRKAFARNLLFALAANALIKPAYILLIDRVVQVRAGSEAYGRYAALFNLATIFGVVLDFGLGLYATRQLAASEVAVRTEVGPLLRARVFLCIGYAVVVLAAALVLGFRGSELGLLGGILGVQALAQTLLFFRACVASLQRFKTDSLLSILDRTLLILVMGSLLLAIHGFGGFWVRWFVAAQMACYGAAVVLAALMLQKRSGVRLSLRGNMQQVWDAVRGSFPYATAVFFMAVYTRVDVLLVERMASADAAGHYAAAFRLLDVGNMVGLTLTAILLPLFGRMLAEGTPTGPVVRTGVTMLLPLSAAVAAVTLFYGAEIMDTFYGSATTYVDDAPHNGIVLAALMAAFPALCLMAVYSPLLTADGGLRVICLIAISAAVGNVGLNLLFIPRVGLEATAMIAAVTQWGVALAFTKAATRRVGLRYDGTWIGRHLLLGLFALGAAWTMRVMATDWRAAAMVVLGMTAAAVFALRLVSIAEMKRLVRR